MVAARLLALACLLALVPAAAHAKALSPQQIAAKLSKQRAKLGMGPVVVNPGWSQSCSLHNRWMKVNRRLQHPEDRGTRAYTERGNWAGTHAVLASGSSWRYGNPWLNAPLHLIQMFIPALTTVGASDSSGHSCVTTWPGVDPAFGTIDVFAAQADHVWTFPADGGTAPYAQRAMESPFTPQMKVGLGKFRVTGPHLYVWSRTDAWKKTDDYDPYIGWDDLTGTPILDPRAAAELEPVTRLVAGSLTGPGGRKVPVKVIDDETVDGYAGTGNGWLLPAKPLKRGARYTATVVLATAADLDDPAKQRQVTHTWSFRTTKQALGPVSLRCFVRRCPEFRF